MARYPNLAYYRDRGLEKLITPGLERLWGWGEESKSFSAALVHDSLLWLAGVELGSVYKIPSVHLITPSRIICQEEKEYKMWK